MLYKYKTPFDKGGAEWNEAEGYLFLLYPPVAPLLPPCQRGISYTYFHSPSGKSFGNIYWASLMRCKSIRLYQSFLMTLLIWRFFHSLRITLYVNKSLVGWISRNLSCSHSSIIQLFTFCLSSFLKGLESWIRYSFSIWNFGCSNWWTNAGVSVSKTNPRLSLSRRPM